MIEHLTFIRCLRSFSKLLDFFFSINVSISRCQVQKIFDVQEHIIAFYFYILKRLFGNFCSLWIECSLLGHTRVLWLFASGMILVGKSEVCVDSFIPTCCLPLHFSSSNLQEAHSMNTWQPAGLPVDTGNCQGTKEGPGTSASKPWNTMGWAAAQSFSPHNSSEAAKLILALLAFQSFQPFQYIPSLFQYMETCTHI